MVDVASLLEHVCMIPDTETDLFMWVPLCHPSEWQRCFQMIFLPGTWQKRRQYGCSSLVVFALFFCAWDGDNLDNSMACHFLWFPQTLYYSSDNDSHKFWSMDPLKLNFRCWSYYYTHRNPFKSKWLRALWGWDNLDVSMICHSCMSCWYASTSARTMVVTVLKRLVPWI